LSVNDDKSREGRQKLFRPALAGLDAFFEFCPALKRWAISEEHVKQTGAQAMRPVWFVSALDERERSNSKIRERFLLKKHIQSDRSPRFEGG
jgi:hypothetical protein